MEIRKLEVDLDNKVLKINGKVFEEGPMLITLPGPEGWPLAILFNETQSTGAPGRYSELRVEYVKPNSML